ncbi:MAG: hypothetical protein ABI416_15985 [Ginsengibacter sp.]
MYSKLYPEDYVLLRPTRVELPPMAGNLDLDGKLSLDMLTREQTPWKIGHVDPALMRSGYQAYSGFDAHSGKSPMAITAVNDLRFEYNEKGINKTITLDANYNDVANKLHPGTITIAPYSSVILIKNRKITK